MNKFLRRVLQGEQGVGMVMVVGFMGLALPMLVAGLALAGTLSNDSQVKSRLAKTQYSSIGAIEYIRYLSENPEDWQDWLDETGGEETLDIGDDTVDIDANADGYTDNGFLDYCIFGSSTVHIKENSNIGCSIGSNGDVDIKEDSVVTGDILSGGNVMLKENVVVNGSVTAAGTVTLKSGATVNGTLIEWATVEAIAGPTPNYGVTITITDENGNVTTENVDVEGSQLGLTFNLTAGGSDVTVNSGDTYNLAPDSYGTVEVKENATLNLSSGSYAFDEIRIKEGTTINLNIVGGAPVIFDAVTVLEFKENIVMNVIGGTAADVVVRVEDQAQFKEDGQYVGTYFGFEAANAEMHVKENSTLVGALYGDVVEVKENAVVTGMPASAVYLSFFGP
jgi:hypothetical protein